MALATGPVLTNENYGATAATEFGEFAITGQPFSSLGPDKFDVSDAVGVIASYNPDTVQFEPVG